MFWAPNVWAAQTWKAPVPLGMRQYDTTASPSAQSAVSTGYLVGEDLA